MNHMSAVYKRLTAFLLVVFLVIPCFPNVMAVETGENNIPAGFHAPTLLSPIVSSAEETTDWGSVDWTTYNWKDFKEEDWESLTEWLHHEADLDTLFYLSANCSNAGYSETISSVISDRFCEDPEGMLLAIAQKDEATCRSLAVHIVVFCRDWDQLITVLESVAITGEDGDEAYAVLEKLITNAEEEFRTEITNPKTADPLTAVLFLLPLSIAGIAVLLRRRKYCI